MRYNSLLLKLLVKRCCPGQSWEQFKFQNPAMNLKPCRGSRFRVQNLKLLSAFQSTARSRSVMEGGRSSGQDDRPFRKKPRSKLYSNLCSTHRSWYYRTTAFSTLSRKFAFTVRTFDLEANWEVLPWKSNLISHSHGHRWLCVEQCTCRAF